MQIDLLLAAALTLLWPVVQYMSLPRESALHPGKLTAALYALHFSMPLMAVALGVAPSFVDAGNRERLMEAVLFSWLCLAGLGIGSHLTNGYKRWGPADRATPTAIVWRTERVVWVVIGLTLASWISRAWVIANSGYLQIDRALQGELEGPFYAAIRMVEVFGRYGVLILIAHLANWHRLGLPVTDGQRRMAIMLAALEFMYWLPTGRKEDTILSILLPMMILNLISGWRPSLKAVGGFVLFLAILFPATHYYRLAIQALSIADGKLDSSAIASLAADTASSTDSALSPVTILFNRISLLEPVSACIRLIDTGAWELKLGESYAMVLLSLVPRVIWPGKPEFAYGHEFASAGGFTAVGDLLTSVSVTYFGEGFLNFGWLGGVPMLLITMLFTVLYRQTQAASDRATWSFLYLSCLPVLMYFGGTFAGYFGSLVKLVPFLFFICVWMRAPQEVPCAAS